jgi:hypothetical protein
MEPILLSKNENEAMKKINELIDGPYVLFIIFDGGGDEASLMKTALHYGRLTDGWQIVQSDDTVISSSIKKLLAKKPDPTQLMVAVDLDEVAAIVTSVNDEIRAVLKKPYSSITNSQVRSAWYAGDSP